MARFKYVGHPGFSEADELAYYGTTFYLGEVSEVLEPLYIAKLERMPAFERVEDDAPLGAADYERVHGRKKPGPKPKFSIDLSGEPKDEDDNDAEDLSATDNQGARTAPKGGGGSGPLR
jgi:hypothetical protein